MLRQNKIRVSKALYKKFISQKEESDITTRELIDIAILNLGNKEFVKRDKEFLNNIISFNSSKEWRDKVNKLAFDAGLSFSKFVRECLELELSDEE